MRKILKARPRSDDDQQPGADRRTGVRPSVPPEAGIRLAVSYSVAIVAGFITLPITIALVNWLYSSGRICASSDDLACPVFSAFGITGAVTLLVLAVGAYLTRLGWLWFTAISALVLTILQLSAADFASPWLLATLVVPLLASIGSDPGPFAKPRPRRVLTLILSLILLLQFLLTVILAII